MNYPSWFVILPPLIVLIITAISKRLNLAFIISIGFAAFIATQGNFYPTTQLIAQRTWSQLTDIDYIYLYVFLLIIGIFIVLLERTGGAIAFAHTFTKHIRSAKAAETSSLLVSAVLFIDDYLSNLTVGYVMRPITDKFSIPRAKLAYLVHSVSIPLIILMPVSSWIAMLTGQLSNSGILSLAESTKATTLAVKINADPFFVFISTIPFIFYSFIALASVLIVIRRRISFGPMHTLEQIASTTGNLFGCIHQVERPGQNTFKKIGHPSLIDFCLPIALLIATFITTILYTGNYRLLGGTNTFIEAFKNTDQSFLAICIAGLVCLACALLLAISRRKITVPEIWSVAKEGIAMMLPSVIMLILATILSTIIRYDLHTGAYLAGILGKSIPSTIIPAIFFIVAALTAFLMGTSWGTIALLLPMATPIMTSFAAVQLPTTSNLVPLLFPGLGALFSGAICGDQLSPISQTSLMASTSTGIDPLTHARTQIPYNIPAIVGAIVAFLVSGIGAAYGLSLACNSILSLITGLLVSTILLIAVNRIAHWKCT